MINVFTHQQPSASQSTKVPDVAGESVLLDVGDFSHWKQQQQVGQNAAECQWQQSQAQRPGKTHRAAHRKTKSQRAEGDGGGAGAALERHWEGEEGNS